MANLKNDFYEYIRDKEYKKEWIKKNLTEIQARVLAQLYKKDFAKVFAQEFEFAVSETYLEGVSLEEAIAWIEKTDKKSFFLKPLGGKGNRGCYPLKKEGGEIFVLGNEDAFTLNDLFSTAKKIQEKNKYPNQWLIEELVVSDNDPDRVGEDVKFYMFYGEIALILQRGMRFSLSKEERVFKWYDENQKSIDVGKYRDVLDESLALNLSNELLSSVKGLSKKIPYPFFRIDYLIGNGGKLYLNEFTPGPGDPEGFVEEVSRKLASLFENARLRLEKDISDQKLEEFNKSYFDILSSYAGFIKKYSKTESDQIVLDDFEIIKFKDYEIAIDQYLKEGFIPKGRDLKGFDITTPIDWDADPFSDRNWMFQLHSLRMLDPVMNKIFEEPFGCHKEINFIINIIEDWSNENLNNKAKKSYAWYDMSVGLRALKIAFIVSFMRKYGYEFDHDFFKVLVEKHIENLSEIKNINVGNHGLFQLNGLMALLWVYPSLSEYKNSFEFAKNQMKNLLDSQLGDYGVHTENSPDYHFFAIKKIENILNAPWWKKIKSEEINRKLEKAKIACYWLVDPVGRCVPVGDSTVGKNVIRDFENVFQWEHKNNSCFIGAVLDGYAVVRSIPTIKVEDSSFLFFTASYQSKTHKHSDCLSFIWQENGENILIDSGKYGYKSGAVREYFLSSRAHNTIEINDESSSRSNDNAYGSGIKKLEITPSGEWIIKSEASGIYEDVKHFRNVLYKPKSYVLVVDFLQSESLDKKKVTNWWHFDESYKIYVESSDKFVAKNESGLEIYGSAYQSEVSEMSVYVGDEEPRLQGWVSNSYLEKTPAPVIGISSEYSKEYISCTLFEYGSQEIILEVFYSEEVKDWVIYFKDLNGDLKSIFHVLKNKYFPLLS